MGLVSHPWPKAGESRDCYLRALAIGNGYSSVNVMISCQFAENLKIEDISGAHLLDMTGHAMTVERGVQLLKDDTYDENVYHYGYLLLPEYHLRSKEHYCPMCMEENPVMLAKWNIAWLPMCLKHNCALEPVEKEDAHILERGGIPQPITRQVAANDEIYIDSAWKAQATLEFALDKQAAEKSVNGKTVVDVIDDTLCRCLGLDDIAQLKERKKLYPMRYFPLNYRDTLSMLECIHSQGLAS
ncbi:MAG: hypothetical protein V7682_02285 [Cycloclasticus sp.]